MPRAAASALQGPPGKSDPARTPGAPTVSESIDQLAGEIRQLRVDFERFFSGALLIPPDELRRRVQARLRQLRSLNSMSAVDRFRLGDLEARHNSYDELFTRRLRDREEGRLRGGPTPMTQMTRLTPPPPPPPSSAVGNAPGAESAAGAAGDTGAGGIVVGADPDPRAVAALYAQVTAAGAPGGGAEGPRFDLASFGSYLQRQAAAIRAKTGCAEVQFRLAAEDGKLRLKARPLAPAIPEAPASPASSKEKT
ncbi:MAG TPA: MXAN_5187 C-terminal domain-containing protein [Thermoanaerobaculia bacterium]|nr:MXAN_5187 C-terminal domain-containing protein [Thermoanaerobaculia bacterium]